MLAAGTCASEGYYGVDLDDDVDWFLRSLITVFRVRFSVLDMQTCWRVQTTLQIFLTAGARVFIFFVRL